MDIYQRVCKKDGLQFDDLADNEIEILDAESDEELPEEEVLECEPEEEKLDLKRLQDELECLKRRIQMMQLKLKFLHTADECPEEECVDFEIELKCSENKEICTLQKGHHKLQCQIYELIRCCNFAKDQIKDLRIRMCEKSREIQQLQKMTAMLNSWKMTLEHEFGICIERFEYLKHVKAEWTDVAEELDKQKKSYTVLEQSFVPKKCFVDEKRSFLNEIKDLRNLFTEFHTLQSERLNQLEARLNSISSVAEETKVLDIVYKKSDNKLPNKSEENVDENSD